jgi:hypothetical protein
MPCKDKKAYKGKVRERKVNSEKSHVSSLLCMPDLSKFSSKSLLLYFVFITRCSPLFTASFTFLENGSSC